MFKLSFDVSYPISNWIGDFESSFLHPLVYKLFPKAPYIVKSFVSGAVLDGVGFVISFAPLVGALFVGLSVLELSGYLPRVPIIFDRFVSKFGVDGRGILPLCLVLVVMCLLLWPLKY